MTAAETIVADAGRDFIRDIVAADLESARVREVVTRFPPEPNGYLHIGHAKSIALNFGVAQEFGGRCHLRFDDTNPTKEEQEYIDAIERDVRWLGFDWNGHLYHASDYFERLYEWAEHLIRAGKAYVDDQSPAEMRANRGTLTEPGRNSPFRERTIEENLDLFRRMRAGEFKNGARVLRAKIDMASGNINLRDPTLYRILHATHPRTGDKWCIYPSYDFAHGQSDAIEGITHSICTLEFEDHRPLYDWFLENLPVPSRPHQYEFARLNLSYTVLSKRVLTELVRDGHVSGWDDPRMPTIAGLRRRGVPPAAIREFVRRVGVAKANSIVDVAMFDHAVREALNRTAVRRMAVLRPLKIVIENYPEGGSEELEAVNHPDNPSAGTRRIRFGRELYLERDDFMENPPKKFYRLSPGREVRLRYAYFITCREVVKNAAGEVTELRCTYDPATRGGNAPDGRKVQATLHWVSAADAVSAEVRLYNQLFTKPDPNVANFAADLNPDSLEVLADAKIEPALAADNDDEPVQFERQGYFYRDPDSAPGRLVFNRTVGLRDTWAKVQASGKRQVPTDAAGGKMDDTELRARITSGEFDITEFKRQFRNASDDIAEAACAFANDYGERRKAGLIVIGLNDDKTCANLPIDDRLIRDVANLLRSGEIQPFPHFVLDKSIVDNCELIAVWVHPSDNTPVRYKGRTCIRIGSRKAYATFDEEKRLVGKRVSAALPFDARGLVAADTDELDLKRFELEILPQMVHPDVLASNKRSVRDQLLALRLIDRQAHPTPAALLTMGVEPRRWLPGAYIQFLKMDGSELSDTIVNAEEIGGNIIDQIRQIEEIFKANIQIAVTITSGVREEQPDYPFLALSQLVRNAVMHRSYDAGFQPVRVTWYSDRVEIVSPGGPYGQVTKENFGMSGATSYRNPTLSEVLKDLNFVERFGIGIPIARSEAQKARCKLEFEPLDNFVLARIWRAE